MSWIYRKIQGSLFRYVYLRCKLTVLACSCPRCPLRRCPPAPQELQVPERGQVLYFAIYLEALCSAPAALSATLLPRWLTMCLQWNAFVEVLPLWLAPNMVTLLGFFFILGNVMLLVIYTPDLVGPVRCLPDPVYAPGADCVERARPGCTTVSHSACGCKPAYRCPMRELLLTPARYSTLDNVDGKQARRTGTSSGLGELFE